MQTKSIDTPLSEITLRRYEKPYNLSKRELIRKLCLSFGLLNPGDSRDVIVDVFYVLLVAKQDEKLISSDEVRDLAIEFRKSEGMDNKGCAASNIRRQIRRLREVLLVEKVKNNYRVTEFGNLLDVYQDKIEKFFIPSILERIKEYLVNVDNTFPKNEQKE
jgi:hypothetical protein